MLPVTKTAAAFLAALSCVPTLLTVWNKSAPVVTDVAVVSQSLVNNHYRLRLSGTIRDGCRIVSGSAIPIDPPQGGRDLGEWEFDLSSGARAVVLVVDLVCDQDRRQQQIGPLPVTEG